MQPLTSIFARSLPFDTSSIFQLQKTDSLDDVESFLKRSQHQCEDFLETIISTQFEQQPLTDRTGRVINPHFSIKNFSLVNFLAVKDKIQSFLTQQIQTKKEVFSLVQLFENAYQKHLSEQPLQSNFYFVGGFTHYLIALCVEQILKDVGLSFPTCPDLHKNFCYSDIDIRIILKGNLKDHAFNFHDDLKQYLSQSTVKHHLKAPIKYSSNAQYLNLCYSEQEDKNRSFDISIIPSDSHVHLSSMHATVIEWTVQNGDLNLVHLNNDLLQGLIDIRANNLRLTSAIKVNSFGFWKLLNEMTRFKRIRDDIREFEDIRSTAIDHLLFKTKDIKEIVEHSVKLFRSLFDQHCLGEHEYLYALFTNFYFCSQLPERLLHKIKQSLSLFKVTLRVPTIYSALKDWQDFFPLSHFYSFLQFSAWMRLCVPLEDEKLAQIKTIKHLAQFHFQIEDGGRTCLVPIDFDKMFTLLYSFTQEQWTQYEPTVQRLLERLFPFSHLTNSQVSLNPLPQAYLEDSLKLGLYLIDHPTRAVQKIGFQILLTFYAFNQVPLDSDFIEKLPALWSLLKIEERPIAVGQVLHLLKAESLVAQHELVFFKRLWLKTGDLLLLTFSLAHLLKNTAHLKPSYLRLSKAIPHHERSALQQKFYLALYRYDSKRAWHEFFKDYQEDCFSIEEALALYQQLLKFCPSSLSISEAKSRIALKLIDKISIFSHQALPTYFDIIETVAKKNISKAYKFWKKIKLQELELKTTSNYHLALKSLQKHFLSYFQLLIQQDKYDVLIKTLTKTIEEGLWEFVHDIRSYFDLLNQVAERYYLDSSKLLFKTGLNTSPQLSHFQLTEESISKNGLLFSLYWMCRQLEKNSLDVIAHQDIILHSMRIYKNKKEKFYLETFYIEKLLNLVLVKHKALLNKQTVIATIDLLQFFHQRAPSELSLSSIEIIKEANFKCFDGTKLCSLKDIQAILNSPFIHPLCSYDQLLLLEKETDQALASSIQSIVTLFFSRLTAVQQYVNLSKEHLKYVSELFVKAKELKEQHKTSKERLERLAIAELKHALNFLDLSVQAISQHLEGFTSSHYTTPLSLKEINLIFQAYQNLAIQIDSQWLKIHLVDDTTIKHLLKQCSCAFEAAWSTFEDFTQEQKNFYTKQQKLYRENVFKVFKTFKHIDLDKRILLPLLEMFCHGSTLMIEETLQYLQSQTLRFELHEYQHLQVLAISHLIDQKELALALSKLSKLYQISKEHAPLFIKIKDSYIEQSQVDGIVSFYQALLTANFLQRFIQLDLNQLAPILLADLNALLALSSSLTRKVIEETFDSLIKTSHLSSYIESLLNVLNSKHLLETDYKSLDQFIRSRFVSISLQLKHKLNLWIKLSAKLNTADLFYSDKRLKPLFLQSCQEILDQEAATKEDLSHLLRVILRLTSSSNQKKIAFWDKEMLTQFLKWTGEKLTPNQEKIAHIMSDLAIMQIDLQAPFNPSLIDLFLKNEYPQFALAYFIKSFSSSLNSTQIETLICILRGLTKIPAQSIFHCLSLYKAPLFQLLSICVKPAFISVLEHLLPIDVKHTLMLMQESNCINMKLLLDAIVYDRKNSLETVKDLYEKIDLHSIALEETENFFKVTIYILKHQCDLNSVLSLLATVNSFIHQLQYKAQSSTASLDELIYELYAELTEALFRSTNKPLDKELAKNALTIQVLSHFYSLFQKRMKTCATSHQGFSLRYHLALINLSLLHPNSLETFKFIKELTYSIINLKLDNLDRSLYLPTLQSVISYGLNQLPQHEEIESDVLVLLREFNQRPYPTFCHLLPLVGNESKESIIIEIANGLLQFAKHFDLSDFDKNTNAQIEFQIFDFLKKYAFAFSFLFKDHRSLFLKFVLNPHLKDAILIHYYYLTLKSQRLTWEALELDALFNKLSIFFQDHQNSEQIFKQAAFRHVIECLIELIEPSQFREAINYLLSLIYQIYAKQMPNELAQNFFEYTEKFYTKINKLRSAYPKVLFQRFYDRQTCLKDYQEFFPEELLQLDYNPICALPEAQPYLQICIEGFLNFIPAQEDIQTQCFAINFTQYFLSLLIHFFPVNENTLDLFLNTSMSHVAASDPIFWTYHLNLCYNLKQKLSEKVNLNLHFKDNASIQDLDIQKDSIIIPAILLHLEGHYILGSVHATIQQRWIDYYFASIKRTLNIPSQFDHRCIWFTDALTNIVCNTSSRILLEQSFINRVFDIALEHALRSPFTKMQTDIGNTKKISYIESIQNLIYLLNQRYRVEEISQHYLNALLKLYKNTQDITVKHAIFKLYCSFIYIGMKDHFFGAISYEILKNYYDLIEEHVTDHKERLEIIEKFGFQQLLEKTKKFTNDLFKHRESHK